MSGAAIRRWQAIHKWSSLVSTAFLLMLCVTGLPLIFHDEIERSMQPALATPHAVPPPLAELIDRALARAPAAHARELYFHPDRRLVDIEIGKPPEVADASATRTSFDLRTGDEVAEAAGSPVLDFLYELHAEMFAGVAGSLFLGAMGLLLLVAIGSGVALYGPFTRKLPFGTVRPARRARWLDLHNLLGIVTLAWLSVVGATGAINTLSGPVAGHWQQTGLAAMAAPFRTRQTAPIRVPVAAAIAAAERAAPGMETTGVYYPGSAFAAPGHYGIYLRGATPVTSRLLTPVLVDVGSRQVDAVGRMPLYVDALLLSQPLHFGDYGGLPLKVIWALLDIMAIFVLATGLWLFVRRGRAKHGYPGEGAHETSQSSAPLSRRQQWRAPSLIAGTSLAALMLALLSPAGPGRWVAWGLLAIPCLAPVLARLR